MPDGLLGIADHIEQFRTTGIAPRTWQVIEGSVKTWVRVSGASSCNDASKKLTAVARILAWAYEGGLDCSPEYVLHPETVEAFITEGLADHATGTRSTYRSHLRAVAEVVVGPDAVPLRQALRGKSDPEAPYDAAERADLYWAIHGLTTPHRRENAEVLWALAIGGGMSTADIGGVCGTDLAWLHGGLICEVTWGPRPRRVVFGHKYEQSLWERAQQVGELPMFRPDRTRIHQKDVPNFLDRLNFPSLPRLTAQRLRVTWIVQQLTAGVPAHVVAEAAGVQEAQIGRYFRHVPSLDEAAAIHALRGSA